MATVDAGPPYRHVCCCIDDIEHAGTALARGRWITRDGGHLSVLHVAPPDPVLRSGLTDWGEVDPADPLSHAARWLEETASLVGGDPVLLSGDPPAEEACRWAAEADVDLLVGAAARAGVRRRLLGSFSSHLARHAPCPVLVLPRAEGGPPPPAPSPGPFAHLACVTDGSAGSTATLEEAERAGTRGHSRISVLSVSSGMRRALRLLRGGRAEPAAEAIAEGARRLSGTGPVRLRGRPGPALERWVGSAAPEVVVVAPGGDDYPSLRRTAEGLAAGGRCCLLVARRPGDGGIWTGPT